MDAAHSVLNIRSHFGSRSSCLKLFSYLSCLASVGAFVAKRSVLQFETKVGPCSAMHTQPAEKEQREEDVSQLATNRKSALRKPSVSECLRKSPSAVLSPPCKKDRLASPSSGVPPLPGLGGVAGGGAGGSSSVLGGGGGVADLASLAEGLEAPGGENGKGVPQGAVQGEPTMMDLMQAMRNMRLSLDTKFTSMQGQLGGIEN